MNNLSFIFPDFGKKNKILFPKTLKIRPFVKIELNSESPIVLNDFFYPAPTLQQEFSHTPEMSF